VAAAAVAAATFFAANHGISNTATTFTAKSSGDAQYVPFSAGYVTSGGAATSVLNEGSDENQTSMITLLVFVLVILLIFFAVSFIINAVVMYLLCKGGANKSTSMTNPTIDAEQVDERIRAASREASRHMDNASRQMESRMEKMHAASAQSTMKNPMRSVELAPISRTSASNPMVRPAAKKQSTPASFAGVNPMNAKSASVAPPAAVSPWTKHSDGGGNTYWFNTVTNQSSWHDPDENPHAELHQHEDSD
jgi:hypothetical protein